jgi:hypothetical protein
MAQTPCIKISDGSVIPDLPTGTTRVGGQVVLLGVIPTICEPTDPNRPGYNSLNTSGVWDVPKDASVFAAGDKVYWNATGNPTVGTAGSGAATSTAAGANLMGMATQPQLTTDPNVRTMLIPAGV